MLNIPLDRALLTGLTATAGVLVLMPLCIRSAKAMGMIDDPTRDARRVHALPIPRVGGVAVAIVLASAWAAQASALMGLPWLLAGIGVLLAAGIIDDRGSLAPGPKLLAQAGAVGLAMAGGWILPAVPIPLTESALVQDWATWPITMLLGLGIINAINLIDGLDGLAAGIGCVAALAFAAMAGLAGQVPACLAATALAGCLVGALAFNTHPARVFLGDTGSMVIGFALFVLAMAVVRGDGGGGVSPFAVLLVLVIPWADSAYVMFSRMLHGRNPFRGDKTHVHHQVLGLGFDHRMAVVALVGISAAIAIVAVALRSRPHDTLFLLNLCLAQGVVFGLRYLRRSRLWTRLSLRLERLRRERYTASIEASEHPAGRRIAAALAVVAVILVGTHVPAMARPAPAAGWCAALAAGLVLIALAVTRRWNHHFVSLGAALCGAVIAFAFDRWAVLQDGLGPVYAVRAATVVAFLLAMLLIWTRKRLHLLVAGPIDLVLIAIASVALWLARDRLGLPLHTVLAPALTWYLACKAGEAESGWRQWLVPAAATVGAVAFAGVQLVR